MCVETVLKCVCWNCSWNVCVETVPEMCVFKLCWNVCIEIVLKCVCWNCVEMRVLKLHPKCVCWNCDWNVCVETAPKMCVLKITVVHLKSIVHLKQCCTIECYQYYVRKWLYCPGPACPLYGFLFLVGNPAPLSCSCSFSISYNALLSLLSLGLGELRPVLIDCLTGFCKTEIEMCVLKLYLEYVCWNFAWNVCVETVLEMCVLKPHLKCVCWNCTWNVYVETVLEMCVLKLHLKSVCVETVLEILHPLNSVVFYHVKSTNSKTKIQYTTPRPTSIRCLTSATRQFVPSMIFRSIIGISYYLFSCFGDCGSNGNLILANWNLMCGDTHISRYSFNTHISGAVSTNTFQAQFQHTHFKCSFNTHISSANFNTHS